MYDYIFIECVWFYIHCFWCTMCGWYPKLHWGESLFAHHISIRIVFFIWLNNVGKAQWAMRWLKDSFGWVRQQSCTTLAKNTPINHFTFTFFIDSQSFYFSLYQKLNRLSAVLMSSFHHSGSWTITKASLKQKVQTQRQTAIRNEMDKTPIRQEKQFSSNLK